MESALDVLARRRTDQAVVSTMTALAPWQERSPHELNLVCLGFMGGASSLALGVALARPDVPVWVIDGDGSLLMQAGSLATIAGGAPARFLHIVIHNEVYETSGAQPLPGGGRVNFSEMALGAGYAEAARFDDAEAFDAAFDDLLAKPGPVLIELMTAPGERFFEAKPAQPDAVPRLAQSWPPVRQALAERERG